MDNLYIYIYSHATGIGRSISNPNYRHDAEWLDVTASTSQQPPLIRWKAICKAYGLLNSPRRNGINFLMRNPIAIRRVGVTIQFFLW